ncbi:MAG: NYN domain-containing protein [Lachnospiraceae bacterium]
MGEQSKKKNISVGLLAHVDAGKTTLSEALLFLSGTIRKQGRVDKKDAYLDTYELERRRGITIFSKQAEFMWKDLGITLLDTPGHVDFSAEMERTLQVLDYAILVISGADGVQGHTETLWKLLERNHIPTFLFINKMDQPGTDREALMSNLHKRLSDTCLEFDKDQDDAFFEGLAVCEDRLLDVYLEEGSIQSEDIIRLISERKVFPVYFGSALKLTGVEELLDGISAYAAEKQYPQEFGARVFKITRDDQGNRLTHLKVTGGVLKVKDLLSNRKTGMPEEEVWEEKVNQIRIYSGDKFETVSEAAAGNVCAVTGLTKTYSGQGLGQEGALEKVLLEPVLTYRLILPEGVNIHEALQKLRQLEEEEPQLHIAWEEAASEIQVQLMGEVQIEVLKSLIKERFSLDAEFGSGKIVYKETIANTVEGVGHYEPLRHYAEVHLLLEAGLQGSGMEFYTDCSEDVLDKNWQRLILTHLEEKKHLGVLTGSEITDMKISVIGGRAHLKHTEGGDFRQSTYRAVRQGLMKAESVLLEPYYEFRLEVPAECIGRAMADVERMFGKCNPPEISEETAVLEGKAPVATMRDYQKELISYSKGRGRLSCVPGGYEPCHNAEEVIAEIGYEAEADLANPSGSVFCAHGAGFYVPWNEVDDYMHVETAYSPCAKTEEEPGVREPVRSAPSGRIDDKELEAIFTRTYGESKREKNRWTVKRVSDYTPQTGSQKKTEPVKEYLLVDGYNIVFAWEELKELAEINIEAARGKLMDILCNYQGYKNCTLILVFDAYKVPGSTGVMQNYHNIHVVYTKEAETADQYIEKLAHEMGRKYNVTVATSDGLEQLIIRGQGCRLLSARELREEIELVRAELRREYLEKHPGGEKNYLFDHMEEELAFYMEQVRLGKLEIHEIGS